MKIVRMNLFSETTEAKAWQVIGNGMHVAQCLIVAVHYMYIVAVHYIRGHCLWNTALGRPLSGTELMRVHGFCVEPAVAQLQNSIIRQLAGDTIS